MAFRTVTTPSRTAYCMAEHSSYNDGRAEIVDDIMAGSLPVRQSETILAPYFSLPNGSALEMRSKPRLSRRGRTS
jgi:hypothetical protein